MPLTRMSGGDLGVKVASSEKQNVTVQIINESGEELEIRESQMEDDMGNMVIGIVIDAMSTNKGGMRTAMGR